MKLAVNTLNNDWDVNGLNQITDRSVEGKQYVIGEANAAAALTVEARDSQVYSEERGQLSMERGQL